MDTLFVVFGLFLMIAGIIGSFMPVIPGPPLSWLGFLILSFTTVPISWWFLGGTLVIALGVVGLDYLIPAIGTKKFGGSRAGMIGSVIGLLVAFIFPVLGFLGIILWPFVGALVGELINKADKKAAAKAAFGSFVGFLTGTFLKFMITIIYLGLYIAKVWEFRGALFSY